MSPLRDIRDGRVIPGELLDIILRTPEIDCTKCTDLLWHIKWEYLKKDTLIPWAIRSASMSNSQKFIVLQSLQNVLGDETMPLAGILAIYYGSQEFMLKNKVIMYTRHLLGGKIGTLEEQLESIVEGLGNSPWNVPPNEGEIIVQGVINFMWKNHGKNEDASVPGDFPPVDSKRAA